MPVKIPTPGALGCAAKIEALLTDMPRRWTDKAAWEKRVRDLQVLILDEGGSFKNDGWGARVQIWGFRASSTEGIEAACRNWVNQVRGKAKAGEGVPS